jgi:hypothetical protein
MTTFEDRLWMYLAEEHEADEVTSKRPRTAGGLRARVMQAQRRPAVITTSAVAVLAVAAAAVVLLVSVTAGTPPAYALTQNPDGSITVTINDLQTAIPQLNARFTAMGVDETVIPITQGCQTQMAVPAFPQSAASDTLTFTPNEGHKYLAPGFDGVLAAGYTSGGQLLVFIGAMKPPLPACFPPDPEIVRPGRGSHTH